jgi:hypothetical protein
LDFPDVAQHFKKKEKLNLPTSQCSIWMIDCWSVHKSEEFQGWMKQMHTNIIILFVPEEISLQKCY